MQKHRGKWLWVLMIPLCFVLFSHLSAEPPSSSLVREILAGEAPDLSEAAHQIADADLILGLAVAQRLRFLAVHGECRYTMEGIESFEGVMRQKVAKSTVVSLSKSPTCSQRIPSQEQDVEGHRLSIPTHFRRPGLSIIECKPQGEAGSLFPVFQVAYVADRQPVSAVLRIDGRPVVPVTVSGSMVEFKTGLSAEAAFALGTHTAEVRLTDRAGQQASASWCFTVGVKPTQTAPIPDTAVPVGSFTISGALLGLSPEAMIEVTVLQKGETRFFRYSLAGISGLGVRSIQTQDPFWLGVFGKRMKRDSVLEFTPKTHYAFPGNMMTFGYTYSGPGTVISQNWGLNNVTSEEPTISAVLQKERLSADLRLTVRISTGEGPGSNVVVDGVKDVLPLLPGQSFAENTQVRVTEKTTGEFRLDHQDSLANDNEVYPNVNEPVAFQGGVLTLHESIVRQVAGDQTPEFEELTATEARVLFAKPGWAEFEHCSRMSYVFGAERYEGDLTRADTALLGLFHASATVLFSQVPKGIIFSTSRYATIDSVTVTLNGQTRTISSPILESPWPLLKSALNPNLPPVAVTRIYPTFFNGAPEVNQTFRVKVTHNDPDAVGTVEISPYLDFVLTDGYSYVKTVKPLVLTAYSLSEPMLNIEFKPEGVVTTALNQPISFSGKYVPLAGLGTGELSQNGGSMMLLDGYETESVEAMNWFQWHESESEELPERRKSVARKNGVEWNYHFQPTEGTGTYGVACSGLLHVREKETDTVGMVTGIGTTQVQVIPELKILSPVSGFGYPVGSTVVVKTTFDDVGDSWKRMKWFLNNTPISPETDSAPWTFVVKEKGKNELRAVLELAPGTLIQSTVVFQGVQLSVQLTPSRKVAVYSATETIPLTLSLRVNDSEIAKPQDGFSWPGSSQQAQATCEWQIITAPEGIVTGLDETPYKKQLTFANPGALTALATVTVFVPLPGSDPAHPASLTVTLPTIRADLWLVVKPHWVALSGCFPIRAINNTKRMFRVKSGEFSFGEQPLYKWAVESGINPLIRIPPALPGVNQIEAKAVLFSWKSPGKISHRAYDHVTHFQEIGKTEVTLCSFLDFFEDGLIEFSSRKWAVSVESLDAHAKALVKPPSFVAVVDGKILLDFLLLSNSSLLPSHSITTMEGAYRLTVKDVSWSQNGTSLGGGNPFMYSAVSPTIEDVNAEGFIEIVEDGLDSPPPPDFAYFKAFSSSLVIAPKIDLQLVDLLGNVPEENEESPGAFVHFNLDNDNRNTIDSSDPHMGIPIADYTEIGFVADEDDLCSAKVKLPPLAIGLVTLKRSNDQIRVWCSPTKAATSAILLSENKWTWDLGDEVQRMHFEAAKGNLWIEGCGKDASYITIQYSHPNERYTFSDVLKCAFFSANCGRQPTPTEEDVLRVGMGLPLIGCEFSITGECDNKYNCIAWAVGENDVLYKGIVASPTPGVVDIDLTFGNGDGEFELEADLDPFFHLKGFDLIVKTEDQTPEKADIIYFENFHAAKRMPCVDGLGKWLMYESKLGTNMRIEHVWDQINSGAYGKPCRFYRKRGEAHK